MIKKSTIFSFCIIIFLITGCAYENNEAVSDVNTSSNKLTIEDINKLYSNGEIINITSYESDYVLVESSEGEQPMFELFNLKNGDRDIMPIGHYYASLEKIQSKNSITFTTTGKNALNSRMNFPFTINCIRNEENPISNTDFVCQYGDKYLNISDSIEFGGKGSEALSDLRITLQGIEMLFEPIVGKEAEFYAADTTIPVTETSYLMESNQFVISFHDAKISKYIKNKDIVCEENNFIHKIELREKGENIIVVVTIKDEAKLYNVKTGQIGDKHLPFVNFSFSDI